MREINFSWKDKRWNQICARCAAY